MAGNVLVGDFLTLIRLFNSNHVRYIDLHFHILKDNDHLIVEFTTTTKTSFR